MGNNNNMFEFSDSSELADFLGAFKYCNSEGELIAEGACAYSQFLADQNKFSWTQSLAVPAAQALAQILLLNYQKSQYDDIEKRRVGYIDAAVKQWCACVEKLLADLKDATDDVPVPAMYQPVSAAGEQFNTIMQNTEMMTVARDYARALSENHLEMDLARAVVLNPKYYEMNEVTWCSIQDLMNGEIPIGLTVQALTKSAGQNFSGGRLGRHCGNYRRNLGILDYNVQKAARAEQRAERQSQAATVSNLARQGDIREMMQTPQQRIAYAIQQAQLIQNSDQNANNACARKAPFLMQQVQVMLQKCQNEMQLLAGKAGLVNSFVPDFASVLNNQVRDVIGGIGQGIDQGAFSGLFNSTASVSNPTPTPAVPSFGNYSGGYVSQSGK